MNEKFRIIALRENPTRRKAKRRRRKIARKATSSPRRRKIARSMRAARGYLVEGLQERGGRIRFLYWTGGKFSPNRKAAKIYRHEKEANKACHASMKGRGASYRLARVIPA